LISDLGSQQQEHTAPALLDIGCLFYHGHIRQPCTDSLQQVPADLGIASLASAEPNAQPHLGTIGEELSNASDFEAEIMLANFGTHANLFDLHRSLALPRLLLFLGSLIDELSIVEQAAHGRLGPRGNLDQIQIVLPRNAQRFRSRDYSYLLAILINQSHLSRGNGLVDAVFSAAYVAFTSQYHIAEPSCIGGLWWAALIQAPMLSYLGILVKLRSGPSA